MGKIKFFKSGIRPTPAELVAAQCASGRPWQEDPDDLDFVIRLVRLIRPDKPKKMAVVDIGSFVYFLRENPKCAAQLAAYLKTVFEGKKFNKFLSDAGILRETDFFFELRKRLLAKILPYLPQKDRLDFVLNQVFYLADDINWVEKIPMEQLLALFDALGFPTIYEDVEDGSAISEILAAMNLIMQRVSGRAMETDVIKMVPEFDNLESPFTAFEVELLQMETRIREGEKHLITPNDLSYRQLVVLHHQCTEFVEKAFANSSKYGISLRVNQNLLMIRQQLERLEVLVPLLVVAQPSDQKENTLRLALQLIRYNCYKNNIRKFIGDSTQLLAYEITQHTAKTGEHYITESRGEYFKMFRAALGGGFIVGILCIIKLLLGNVDTSFFGHAFLYSMNYSLGFIAIYLCGFTLATKQPAMTASALIRSLEEGLLQGRKASDKYKAFAIFFARVFRSQFIAFVGNVIMAFPVSLLGVWGIWRLSGVNIAMPKWATLLTDLSPYHSPAIFHAAIAGVFLFLSGIISGSVANRDKHHQVYFRIAEHPLLKKYLGKQRPQKLANWYEKRWAGLISNFWFGIFMGSTASIGLFLGLNLDIRHITFASGNMALGLFGTNFIVNRALLYWGIVGIGLIGLVNFLVSFSLSMLLAFRSRNLPIGEFRPIALSIWRHFLQQPFSFFIPVERKPEKEKIAELPQKTAAHHDA